MNDEIRSLQRTLTDGMVGYMNAGRSDEDDVDSSFEAGYSQEHIDRCNLILESFFGDLSQISGVDRNTEIMEAVKAAVEALNDLNDEAGYSLIETDQRELLCEIIIAAARESGLQTETYDTTEGWREW
jgi:hypothetical protein